MKIQYAARLDEYGDRDDLEHVAGNADDVEVACEAIADAARIKNGPRAERSAATLTMELPADSTQEQRAAVAEALVRQFADEGRPALAAVHRGEPDGSPRTHHLHLVVAARPIVDGIVDRRPQSRMLVGKAAVRQTRQAVAELVNGICRPEVAFWGGRDAEMETPGIVGRAPRKRVPQREWYVLTQRDRDPSWVEVQATVWEARREQAAKRRAERDQRRQEREAARPAVQAAQAALAEARRQLQVEGMMRERAADRAKAGATSALKPLTDEQRKLFSDRLGEINRRLGDGPPLTLEIIDRSSDARSMAFAVIRVIMADQKDAARKSQERPAPAEPASSIKPRSRKRSPEL